MQRDDTPGRKLRIAIVGYGVAGIAAALFLRRQAHQIVHFEQAPKPSFAGAGLLLQPAGLAVLQELGLRDAALSRGVPVTRLIGCTLGGSPVMDIRYDEFEPGLFGLGIQRSALFDLLRRADKGFGELSAAQRIAGVEAEHGYLRDAQGGMIGPFDLIVGADGMDSRIRQALAGLARFDRPYGWGALLCLLDDVDGIFLRSVSQHFSAGRHVSIWPVGSLEPGAPRRINLSWRTDPTEPPGDLETWKRRVSTLCPAVTPLLRQICGMNDLLAAAYRDVSLKRYHRGRVVLIGDAAHCMSPQLGQGASMALLDAQALAAALTRYRDVPAALAAFDRERRPHVEAYQRISRMMTPVFQSDSRTLIMLRDRAFHPLTRLPPLRRLMLKTLSGRPREHRVYSRHP